MLSIGRLSSAGGAASYYTASQYYLDGTDKSQWGGGARDAVGLSDERVQSEELTNLLEGKNARGVPLTQRADSDLKRDVGRDLTFTMPKSASILAVGPMREKILAAHVEANDVAMSFVENCLVETRVTDLVTKKQVPVGDQKIVYASFCEQTSRANDPNEHIHNVVPNLALGDDGKFRAIHNEKIYANRNLAGAVYRAELAKGLRALGLSLRPAGKNGLFEIKGISDTVLATFSKRRAQIDELHQDSKNPDIDRSDLVAISRPAKQALTQAELHKSWNEQLQEHGQSFETLTQSACKAAPDKVVDAATSVKAAISDLSETRSYWTKLDLYKAILLSDVPSSTFSDLEVHIDKTIQTGGLLISKDGNHLSTPAIQSREKAVISEYNAGHLRGKTFTPDKATEGHDLDHPLTAGQSRACDLILSARDRIIGIQGSAGVGKTTSLKSVATSIKQAGYELIGLAPSSAAVAELEKTCIFDRTMTTQQFDRTPIGHDRSVIVVDEASMVGTKSMLNLLRYANKREVGKLVLVGDVKQLESVEAGRPFAGLQAAGMQTAIVDEIVRQESQRHREGLEALANDNVKRGLELLKPEIHECERTDLVKKVISLWEQSSDHKMAIIVQTNAQKQNINRQISEGLQRGQTSPDAGHETRIWRPVHKTSRERTLANTYSEASHVRFNRDIKRAGIKRGEVYKIKSVDRERSAVQLQMGKKSISFQPAKYKLGSSTVELYRQDKITLREGDRVRFTRGWRTSPVNNNDLATVSKITEGRVHVELDNGKKIALEYGAQELRHIDHGWANTGHAFQGKTVKNAIVVMPANRGPLTTLKSLYVGASRHKESLAIVTDSAKSLKAHLIATLGVKPSNFSIVEAPVPEPPQVPEPVHSPHLENQYNHDKDIGESHWDKLEREYEEERERYREEMPVIERGRGRDFGR